MELTNDSGYPATLARAQLLYRDLMLATVVVKASFEVAADGVVRPVDAEAQLPVSDLKSWIVSPLVTGLPFGKSGIGRGNWAYHQFFGYKSSASDAHH